MSNPARRRGRGGNTQPPSETSSARGGGLAPFDGPASRGGGSNVSSTGRPPSMPPSTTSPAGSPPASPSTSPRAAQSATFAPASGSPSSAGGPALPLTDPARDPARQARLTDTVRNVDLPASLYNLDNLVRLLTSRMYCHIFTRYCSFPFTCLQLENYVVHGVPSMFLFHPYDNLSIL